MSRNFLEILHFCQRHFSCPEGKKSKLQSFAQFGNLLLLELLCIFVSKKMARIGEGRFEAKDRARWRSLEAEKWAGEEEGSWWKSQTSGEKSKVQRLTDCSPEPCSNREVLEKVESDWSWILARTKVSRPRTKVNPPGWRRNPQDLQAETLWDGIPAHRFQFKNLNIPLCSFKGKRCVRWPWQE